MVEKKLQFSDLREARAVLGMKDEFLKTLQREFPDCRIAVRGDTAMIVGSDTDVEQVLDVFAPCATCSGKIPTSRPSTSATRQASSKPGGAKNCAASMKIRSAFLPAIASSSPRRWDKNSTSTPSARTSLPSVSARPGRGRRILP